MWRLTKESIMTRFYIQLKIGDDKTRVLQDRGSARNYPWSNEGKCFHED